MALALVFDASAALGQTTGGTVVYPSKESITILPGKSVKKSLLIVNGSSASITLKVSVRDIKPLDESGGITFYNQEGGFAAQSWLFPQYETVTIGALNSQKMEYIVSAAKDMPGRGYAGAIAFELYDVKNKKTAGEPFGTIVNVNVLAKGITTGGAIKSFTSPLVQFNDPIKFNFAVENTSNSNLSLSGNAVFTNLFGKEVGRFKTGQLDVYPQAKRNFKFEWSDAQIFGVYMGNVTLVDSLRKDNIINSRTLLIFLPWQKLLVTLLGIGAVAGAAVWLWRIYAKKRALNLSAKAAIAASLKDMLARLIAAGFLAIKKTRVELAKIQSRLPIFKR